jgi:hypothetical protein
LTHEDEILAYSPRRTPLRRLRDRGCSQSVHHLSAQSAQRLLITTPQAIRHFGQAGPGHLQRTTGQDLFEMNSTPHGTGTMTLGWRNHSGLSQKTNDPLVEPLARPPVRQPVQPRQHQGLASVRNESFQVHGQKRTQNSDTIKQKVSPHIDKPPTTM